MLGQEQGESLPSAAGAVLAIWPAIFFARHRLRERHDSLRSRRWDLDTSGFAGAYFGTRPGGAGEPKACPSDNTLVQSVPPFWAEVGTLVGRSGFNKKENFWGTGEFRGDAGVLPANTCLGRSGGEGEGEGEGSTKNLLGTSGPFWETGGGGRSGPPKRPLSGRLEMLDFVLTVNRRRTAELRRVSRDVFHRGISGASALHLCGGAPSDVLADRAQGACRFVACPCTPVCVVPFMHRAVGA